MLCSSSWIIHFLILLVIIDGLFSRLLTTAWGSVMTGAPKRQILPSEYIGTKKKKQVNKKWNKCIWKITYIKKNVYIEVGLLHSMKPLVSWGVTGSDELPPPLAFQCSGSGASPLHLWVVVVQVLSQFCEPLPSFCWLSRSQIRKNI